MNIFKKIFAVVLCISILSSLALPTFAAQSNIEPEIVSAKQALAQSIGKTTVLQMKQKKEKKIS